MSGSRASQSRHYLPAAELSVPPRTRNGTTPTASRAGYTIIHAGRQIRFGPVAFWIAVGSVVVMAGWSVATATYFAFRDDVLRGLVARQTEQQFAYEDRLAELRAQIDRTTSRQLLDQEQLERKLEELARREATLESHATALGAIGDPTPTGSIRGTSRGAEASGTRPSPAGDTFAPPQRPDHGASFEHFRAPASGKRAAQVTVNARLESIEASLDRVEKRQAAALHEMEERYQGKARKFRNVLAELGLKLGPAPRASGGPFVPVKFGGDGHDFERALSRVNLARTQADELSHTIVAVPLRKPVGGEIDTTSNFGVRMDPFLHVAAMHTGIDFRGDLGEPIHATAAGTVSAAGWSGGYGKMVEIDHGNGLATRYGHLSQINLSVGEKVRIGEIVGRLGSTGRSTGPHLHYETRIDGEAVDPQKFLHAGAKLFGE
jgi:murein DD-endopeptidase MepM/ murein hydrolase activator NlpD